MTSSVEGDYTQARGLAKDIVTKAKQVEPKVSPVLQKVAADNGGRMAGFENRIKKEDSLTRKIHDKAALKNKSEEQYASEIGDALRYTIVLPDDSFSTGAQGVMDGFSDYEIKDVENNFQVGNSYKGLHMTLVDPETSLAVELQLHTEASIAAKDPSHDLFEKTRLPETSDEESEALTNEMFALWDKVPEPAGVQQFGKPVFRKSYTPGTNSLVRRHISTGVRGLYVLQ